MMWLWWATAWAGPDIAMLGNSYTHRNGMPDTVAAMLSTLAPRSTPEVSAYTGSGKRWSEHVTDVDDYPAMQEELHYAVLQEQSQIPGFPRTDEIWIESAEALLTLRDEAVALGATPVVLGTWGRRDGDPRNAGIYPTYIAMQDRLDDGFAAYRAMARDSGPSPVFVPIGTTFRSIHDTSPNDFLRLFAPDGSHPSAIGSWLMACEIAVMTTGRRPDERLLELLPEDDRDARLPGACADALEPDAEPGSAPWAFTFEAWTTSFSDERVAHPWLAPQVFVKRPLTLSTLALGSNDDPGTLRIEADTTITTLEVEVAGKVLVTLGTLALHSTDGNPDAPCVEVEEGGTLLDAPPRAGGPPALALHTCVDVRGTLRSRGRASMTQLWGNEDAVLEIALDGDPDTYVDVSQNLTWGGTLRVIGAPTQDVTTLVRFGTIEWIPTALEVPEGFHVEIGRRDVLLVRDGATPSDTGMPTTDGEALPSCGCAQPSPRGWPALWAIAAAIACRRRRT